MFFNCMTTLNPPTLTKIKSISYRYYAVLNGLLTLVALFLYLHLSSIIYPLLSIYKCLFFIVPIVMILGIVSGIIFSRGSLKEVKCETSIENKLTRYFMALHVKFLLPAMASLFGIVVYLLTGNLVFIVMIAISIGYLILIKPSEEKMISKFAME